MVMSIEPTEYFMTFIKLSCAQLVSSCMVLIVFCIHGHEGNSVVVAVIVLCVLSFFGNRVIKSQTRCMKKKLC